MKNEKVPMGTKGRDLTQPRPEGAFPTPGTQAPWGRGWDLTQLSLHNWVLTQLSQIFNGGVAR